jgi:hypothetical protein
MSKPAIAFLCATTVAAIVTLNFEDSSSAAEAVFTQDGKRIYFLNEPTRSGDSPLVTLDIATGLSTPFILPKEIKTRGELFSLERSRNGFLLFLFSDSIWAYDPVKKTSARVCAAQPGQQFYDLACDPITGQIFFGSTIGLGYLEGDNYKFHPVISRRVDQYTGLTRLQRDCFIFSVSGDAWLGRIDNEPLDGGKVYTTLLAYRFAPLATLETGNYTPGVQGAAEFAVTEQWLYVHARRMGGSGDGVILRMQKPDPNTLDDTDVLFDVKKRSLAIAKDLLSVEMVGKNGYSASLCSSPDGTTVFYRIEEDNGDFTNWLATDAQQPRKISGPSETKPAEQSTPLPNRDAQLAPSPSPEPNVTETPTSFSWETPTSQALKEAEDALSREYEELRQSLSTAEKEFLIREQTRWLREREKVRNDLSEYLRMTWERVQELNHSHTHSG